MDCIDFVWIRIDVYGVWTVKKVFCGRAWWWMVDERENKRKRDPRFKEKEKCHHHSVYKYINFD